MDESKTNHDFFTSYLFYYLTVAVSNACNEPPYILAKVEYSEWKAIAEREKDFHLVIVAVCREILLTYMFSCAR